MHYHVTITNCMYSKYNLFTLLLLFHTKISYCNPVLLMLICACRTARNVNAIRTVTSISSVFVGYAASIRLSWKHRQSCLYSCTECTFIWHIRLCQNICNVWYDHINLNICFGDIYLEACFVMYSQVWPI